MKKLVIFGFLIMPFFVKAQEFQQLRARADSLKNKGYYDRAVSFYGEALFLYRQAMSQGVNPIPPATDQEWQETLISLTESTYKAYRDVDVPGAFWDMRYGKGEAPPIPKQLLYYKDLKPLVRAKEFHRLQTEADSLSAHAKYSKALKLYDAALQQITSYKETVNEFDFMHVLYNTSAIQDKLDNVKDDGPIRINNAYKNVIETTAEKLAKLKTRGVTNICSFTFYDAGTTESTFIFTLLSGKKAAVSTAHNQYLLWLDGDDLYMQAFSSVNVNPPLKLGNELLRNLVRDHYNDMLAENMKKLLWHGFHERYYTFNFYKSDGTVKEVKFQESDIKDPHPPKSENRFSPKDVESYNANIKTFIYQFELQATEAWWEYNKRLKTDF